mmetsp:Transcript_23904/g.54059  ORF Transcript_23904/g.54059 Transcript_23904/m.54059 type:complete len:485 (+) Transcript_23904:166-1620(+)
MAMETKVSERKASFRDSLYGIGVDDREDDLEELLDWHPSNPSNGPKDMEGRVEKILAYVEQMQVTSRDNNAILHQMLATLEEKVDKRFEDLRTEVLGMVRGEGLQTPARRRSTLEVHSPPPTPDPYDLVPITPYPGFVVKTRQLLGEKNKVFINIFHHELIALEPPGMTREQAMDKPYMMMEMPSTTVDRAGQSCTMFNVGISSEYFIQPNDKVDIIITAPATIYKIVHKINLKFGEFLDEGNYSIPRLSNGYKGDIVPCFSVPLLKGAAKPDNFLPPTPPAAWTSLTSEGGAGADPFEVDERSRHHRRDSENDSVVSDITGTTLNSRVDGGSHRRGSAKSAGGSGRASGGAKVQRKSIVNVSMGYTGGSIAGRNLLSTVMLEYYEAENISGTEAAALKAEAVADPTVLLGWQIWLTEAVDSKTMYVVTDCRKNYLSKTEYRISRFKTEDSWVRLRRVEGRGGMEFRPMRKVLWGLQVEDESVA